MGLLTQKNKSNFLTQLNSIMKPTSVVLVRRIWPNANSEKNQVNVMLQQTFEGSGNPLIQITQGIKNETKAVAVVSFANDQAMKYFGTVDADYSERPSSEWPTLENIEAEAGMKACLQITESLTPNPARKNPTPQVNPQTNEVLLQNGSPIYREVTLVVGEPSHTFITHNGTIPAEAFKSEAVVSEEETHDAFQVNQ